jgi:hypothetical protein
MSLDYQGFMRDYTIWSRHWEVGENILQETFDDVIMPDVAPHEAITNEEMSVNTQPVATDSDCLEIH